MLVSGETGKNDALCALNEIFRVLRAKGKFIMVSHGGDDERDDELAEFTTSRLELLKVGLTCDPATSNFVFVRAKICCFRGIMAI